MTDNIKFEAKLGDLYKEQELNNLETIKSIVTEQPKQEAASPVFKLIDHLYNQLDSKGLLILMKCIQYWQEKQVQANELVKTALDVARLTQDQYEGNLISELGNKVDKVLDKTPPK